MKKKLIVFLILISLFFLIKKTKGMPIDGEPPPGPLSCFDYCSGYQLAEYGTPDCIKNYTAYPGQSVCPAPTAYRYVGGECGLATLNTSDCPANYSDPVIYIHKVPSVVVGQMEVPGSLEVDPLFGLQLEPASTLTFHPGQTISLPVVFGGSGYILIGSGAQIIQQ